LKVTAIVNPAAGSPTVSRRWPAIKEKLSTLNPEIIYTRRPGDATSIAVRVVKEETDYLLCVGGDGTINEVLQGVVNSRTVLVPVSAGTGSDFVKSIGNPSLESIIEAVKNNSYADVDSALTVIGGNRRYFLNILEAGFGSVVMEYVNTHRKSLGSFNRGVLSSLKNLRKYEMTFESDAYTGTLKTVEVVVANGRYFGGGMLAAPGASITDGLLDVHIVGAIGRLGLAAKFGKLRDGTYVDDRNVTSFRTSSISIKGNAPVEADGENIGTAPLEITVMHNSVRIVSPAGWSEGAQ
jgi:YegS/Rv2252/BmrU family lipid kinase